MNQVLTNAQANDADFARRMLRATIKDSGLTCGAWARENGFSLQYVSAVQTGRKGRPSDRLCAAIGLRRVVSFIYDPERARALG